MLQSLTDFVVKATALVAQMTLEEKALLLSGDGWWRTHRVEARGHFRKNEVTISCLKRLQHFRGDKGRLNLGGS